MPLLSRKISPFKFLKSYQKDDIDSYFGRKKETDSLFDLYKDSSLIVLHGPSGSGKTSLICCGLLNKANLKRESVASIRRDQNFITSIKKTLFIQKNDADGSIEDKSALLDNFLKSFSELRNTSKGIETIDELILDVEDELLRLKKRKSKNNSSNIGLVVDDVESKIIKNNEALNHYIDERKSLIEKLTVKNQNVIDRSILIAKFFKYKHRKLHHIPLLIFDQFEELFVYADEEEIKKFGLFLKLIFDYKISFNIIISLREEYFGHLDQLQNYIPNIFYRKIRLAHPNRDTITDIIYKSFAKFNINQYKDHTVIQDRELLSKSEKETRINQIIEQIKIQDGADISYHLPFLQVYLDSLYKVDYQRTYPKRVPDTIINEYGEYPPLEFKEQEIKEFGSIEKVLEQYIKEVNHKIIDNASNKLNNRNQHKDSVIKFLRHFKTKNDHKRRITISRQNNGIYIISNEKTLKKIQIDVWGNQNDHEYNDTISEIIEELAYRGILTVGTDYVELSHDIIAKVISGMRTEEDFRLLIKRDFDSSYAIFLDTKRNEDLLNPQQVIRIRQCKDYVINDDRIEEFNQKQDFFDKSILYNEKVKKEKQGWRDSIRDKEKMLIKKYARVLLAVFAIFSLILGLFLWGSRNSKKIYKTTSDAFKIYEIDKTLSFLEIKKADQLLDKNKYILGKDGKRLIHNFKNEFYKNYLKYPFYFNSIDLESGHIIDTKTRYIKKGSIILFALTSKRQLITTSIQYTDKNALKDDFFKPIDSVLAYEPFEKDQNLFVLIARRSKNQIALKLLDHENNPKSLCSNRTSEIFINGSSISDIEKINESSFLIGVDRIIYKIELGSLTPPCISTKIIPLDTLASKIRKIKSYGHEDYIILHGSNSLCFKTKNTAPLHYSLPQNDSIYSFMVTGKLEKKLSSDLEDKLLIGLEGKLLKIDLKDPDKSYEQYNVWHNKRISSIDINDKNGNILLGSFDNTVSLWNSEFKMVKHLMGHKDAVHNVSFVKENPNFIITSGEDEKIKIWNLEPIAADIKNNTSIEAIFKNRKNTTENRSTLSNTRSTQTDIIVNIKQNDIILSSKIGQKETIKLTGHKDKVRDFDFSEHKTYIVSGSSDNTVIIWKNKSSNSMVYENIQVLKGHTDDVIDVEFKGDSLLLTASNDNTIQIYKKKEKQPWLFSVLDNDTSEFVRIPSIIRHDYAIEAATFSEDGKYIISKDVKKNIKKWKYEEFQSLVDSITYGIKKNVLIQQYAAR